MNDDKITNIKKYMDRELKESMSKITNINKYLKYSLIPLIGINLIFIIKRYIHLIN